MAKSAGHLKRPAMMLSQPHSVRKSMWSKSNLRLTSWLFLLIRNLQEQDFFLPKPCLKTLYYCLVYPYLHYCIIVWGSTYKTNLRRLVSLQKRVIRIISKSTFDSHSDPIFKELELLKLFDIRQIELGKLMFSFNHSLFSSKVQR